MKYRKVSHTTFDCRYHLVRVTRFRNDALGGELVMDLDDRLRELCAKMYVNVISIGMEEDHVHMYISIPVSKPIPYVVQRLKGITSKDMMRKHRKYLKTWYWAEDITLRARGYFICTIGDITSDVVKNYVESQGKEENLGFEIEL